MWQADERQRLLEQQDMMQSGVSEESKPISPPRPEIRNHSPMGHVGYWSHPNHNPPYMPQHPHNPPQVGRRAKCRVPVPCVRASAGSDVAGTGVCYISALPLAASKRYAGLHPFSDRQRVDPTALVAARQRTWSSAAPAPRHQKPEPAKAKPRTSSQRRLCACTNPATVRHEPAERR